MCLSLTFSNWKDEWWSHVTFAWEFNLSLSMIKRFQGNKAVLSGIPNWGSHLPAIVGITIPIPSKSCQDTIYSNVRKYTIIKGLTLLSHSGFFRLMRLSKTVKCKIHTILLRPCLEFPWLFGICGSSGPSIWAVLEFILLLMIRIRMWVIQSEVDCYISPCKWYAKNS